MKHFSVMHDKTVSSALCCRPVWCPKMDLLAFATEDNRLVVHRYSWQKLFSVMVTAEEEDKKAGPEGPLITCLAWQYVLRPLPSLRHTPLSS